MKNMKLGHLNRLYLQYSELIESTDIGKNVLSALESDHRVSRLEGHMISRGSGASRFEPKVLAMWFLWAINEFGQKIAEENLNKFLDSYDIPIINTLWILGVELEETIKLTDGLCLTPITDMPDSREKEIYLKHSFDMSGHDQPRPKAAITYLTKITKSQRDDDQSSTFEKDVDFWNSSKLLYDASLALNAIENTSCIPYFSTSYTLPQMPIGPFGGSGGGRPLHDVIGHKVSKITIKDSSDINTVLSAFLAMPDKEKARYSRVLSRLSQSKRREQIEDKILDLGIALEMALLDDNKNNQQLSLTFRLRGSWLISTSDDERLSIYRDLRDIYNYRSQVAHSGMLCGNDAEKINSVRESFSRFSLIAERIVCKLICEKRPEWSKLLLGII